MNDLLNYKKAQVEFVISKFCKVLDGGKGSGNFGHKRKPGEIGGLLSSR